ncbi:MAG: adenylate/guanylate cyclase domain-containing protein [Anaerolineae bacterium]|nr:adenylate/guanylate cyclase domain-containing protein [Anaerolineae bacterium]
MLVIEDPETLATFIQERLLVDGGSFVVERAKRSGNGHRGNLQGEYDLVLCQVQDGGRPVAKAAPAEPAFALQPQGEPSPWNREIVFDGVRVLSVVVADIAHSTPLTRALGPQAMLEFLKDFYLEMMRAVGRAGCTKQYSGDQVLALFEEPAEAVEAALRMCEAFGTFRARWREQTSVEAGLGVGIATGMVAGDAGAFRHVLAGAPVVVAARLSALSKGEGAILLDETTYRGVRGAVGSVRKTRPRQIKGFPSPIQVYKIAMPHEEAPKESPTPVAVLAGVA